jgi:hypothetical protein
MTDCSIRDPKSACLLSQCADRPGLQQFGGSGGQYQVTLNAGYRLDITALDYETSIQGMVTVSAGGVSETLTTQSHPNMSIPAANMQRLVTIQGPTLAAQYCGPMNTLIGNTLVLHFEDYDDNMNADCNEPILQLTAE